MSEWKFSKSDVPAFLYLLDQIVKDDFYKHKGNIYKKIVTEGTKNKEEVHNRSIRRAFRFRKQLLGELPASKKIPKPSLSTLNCIVNYYFEGNPDTFLDYVKGNAETIKDYPKTIELSKEELNEVFNIAPPKIEMYHNHKDGLEMLLEELKDTSLASFVEEIAEERLTKAIASSGQDKVRIGLEQFIEERIANSEKKLKRASLVYRFLGGFGLLFVATPQFTDLKTYIIDSFEDDFEDDFDVADEDEDDEDDDMGEVF